MEVSDTESGKGEVGVQSGEEGEMDVPIFPCLFAVQNSPGLKGRKSLTGRKVQGILH